MRIHNIVSALALAGALAALGGCGAGGLEVVEQDFGNSVRHMVQSQIADPAAPMDTQPIDAGDGPKVNTVFESYRKDVSKPEDVKRDIVINVDSSK